MKNALSLALICFTLITSPLSAQQEIGGIELPAALKAGNTSLTLNGGGLFEKWFHDIYVVGLYLLEKSSDAQAIIDADKAMGMRIHMVSGMCTSERMKKGTEEGFEKATKNNTGSIRTQINQFTSVFTNEPIEKMDIYDIFYVPGAGVDVLKNGTKKETIGGGMEFKKALFGIWLCDDPADEDLKEGMLGGSSGLPSSIWEV